MLKLKLQYFGHLIRRSQSLEKTLMLDKTERRKRKGSQWLKWLDIITDLMDSNLSLSKLQQLVLQGNLLCCSPWDHKDSDMTVQLN